MNTIRRIHRLVGLLAATAASLLIIAAASPAMAATTSVPPYGPSVSPAQVPPPLHAVTAGGMPGWQITLIAAGAAVLAAILAVAAYRARASRRHIAAPSLWNIPPTHQAARSLPGRAAPCCPLPPALPGRRHTNRRTDLSQRLSRDHLVFD
jgi:hypothetical protein